MAAVAAVGNVALWTLMGRGANKILAMEDQSRGSQVQPTGICR